jgi:UDP-glucose 4-epimerase
MNKHIILVTGAAGYIGSVTCDSLLAQGYQIIAIDNLSKGHLGAIRYLENKYGKKSFTWVQKDITTDDLSSLFKESHIDAIVHFAALLNAGESWQIPEKYVTNNVCGTQRLTSAALAAGVQKLVFGKNTQTNSTAS